MLTISELSVCGFRGFNLRRNFVFDRPVTVLFGQNHLGKSSTLNAIEWALFGHQCIGKSTEIPERKGWEVKNKFSETGCEVSLSFDNGGGQYRLERKFTGKRTKYDDSLRVTLPSGTECVGTDAETHLSILRDATFGDFSASAYQHQESLRSLLVAEPKNRNEALTRLLGLAHYSDFITAINAAKLGKQAKDIDGQFGRISTAVRARRGILERELEGLCENSEIALAGPEVDEGIRAAAVIHTAITQFADKDGITVSMPEMPVDLDTLMSFCTAVDDNVADLRSKLPMMQEQATLFEQLAAYRDMIERHKVIEDEYHALRADISSLGHSPQSSPSTIRTTEEIQDLECGFAETVLMSSAFTLLTSDHTIDHECPLCGGNAPGLLTELQEQRRAGAMGSGESSPDLFAAIRDTRYILTDLADRQAALETKETAFGIACEQLLGPGEGGARPSVEMIKSAHATCQERLQVLSEHIKSRQQSLTDIADDISSLRDRLRVFAITSEMHALDHISTTTEYINAERVYDRVSTIAHDARVIRQASSQAAQNHAREIIKIIGPIIVHNFLRISDHRTCEGITISVGKQGTTGLNTYSFVDADGVDVLPLLSQGDLNALALATFLALGASNKQTSHFGFVMLDDPSQSLASDHKRRLAILLNEMSHDRQIVISTMDTEFAQLVGTTSNHAQTQYTFTDWSTGEGPSVTRGSL